MSETPEDVEVHDKSGALTPDFAAAVREALSAEDVEALRKLVDELHPADLADLIESLEPRERAQLISLLGRHFDPEALAELDENVRDGLMEVLPPETIASAIRKLDTDDAIYLLEDLDSQEQQDILARVPPEDRSALKRGLDFPENTAGRLMQTEFVAVPPYWTVGQTIDYMRSEPDLPDKFVEIYVVDEGFHLQGAVPVSRILRHPRSKKMSGMADEVPILFKVTDERDDLAYRFKQYNLVSAPVIDENERLVGMLMVDDVVDIIQEEAEEDILHLGGVGDEQISDPVWVTIRSRFAWLFALIVGMFAFWWFGSGQLGLVIASAMVINLIAAALSGILIPITLDRMGIDPAIASAVFVTTVTDVVGFLAFLGLAAIWLA
jgi:magnesium transporter